MLLCGMFLVDRLIIVEALASVAPIYGIAPASRRAFK